MRSLNALLALPLLLTVVACDGSTETKDSPTRQQHYVYDYALDLPPRFVLQKVQGIDSKVEEFRSAGTTVWTDFGQYSAPPSCDASMTSCEIRRERIACRQALVATFEHGGRGAGPYSKPHRVFVHIPVDQRDRLDLNLFASCDTEVACNESLAYFRRVRLIQRERPPPSSNLGAPPAPPPPVRQQKRED